MPHVVGVVCSCGFKSTVESSIHIANILAPEGITRVISRYVYLTNQPRNLCRTTRSLQFLVKKNKDDCYLRTKFLQHKSIGQQYL